NAPRTSRGSRANHHDSSRWTIYKDDKRVGTPPCQSDASHPSKIDLLEDAYRGATIPSRET
ncbi:MAG: hypothetical protein P4L99_14970, partial [Chthoniobacter sp.]|nr:hypothetical protein [Chthoniobacter sp.]